MQETPRERRFAISYIGTKTPKVLVADESLMGDTAYPIAPYVRNESDSATQPLIALKGRRKQSIAVLRGPDVHLVAIQICRAALFGAGIAATLACLSSTAPSPRQRLQCALSAAVCAISSMYYVQFYSIRKRPNLAGYTLAGNAAVDALRYASWSACITLLAWNALIFRGPFGKNTQWVGMTYESWLVMGPLFACGGVLLGIPGWHSARSSSKDASCSRLTWLAVATLLLLLAVAMSLSLAYTIQFAPFDLSVRTEEEIRISRVMSGFWFVYPLVSCMRTLGMMVASSRLGIYDKVCTARQPHYTCVHSSEPMLFTKNPAVCMSSTCAYPCRYVLICALLLLFEYQARVRMPRLTNAVCTACNLLVFGIQKAFSTLTMAPMDIEEFNSITEFLECNDPTFVCDAMRPSPVPVWVTQMCDFAISIVDIVTQVYSAVACVAYALPIVNY